jgi:hypothetical protein
MRHCFGWWLYVFVAYSYPMLTNGEVANIWQTRRMKHVKGLGPKQEQPIKLLRTPRVGYAHSSWQLLPAFNWVHASPHCMSYLFWGIHTAVILTLAIRYHK